MVRERATALLVDFDGVLRRWDPAVAAEVEREYGLSTGVLGEIATSWGLLQPVLTGRVSHADWMSSVADALTPSVGDPDRARAAVEQWQRHRGEVDPQVLAFIREVRAAGIRVGLGTNATDQLDADLAALDLTDELDVVVNSSVIGVHKPAKEYFQAACVALETPPDRVLFVDDEDRAISGARVAGLSAYRWNGPEDLRYLRAALAC
ncbi:HAD-IA family hydrolase [Micromonospora fiedleri]|uniref:HAD-IA family hydrolase n=1 Tax=Micromonospora fiedleri TaxID=1157498 RepID=A0ABS1UIX6_9ACTN|nr:MULTISPECIES: HAD-IA family hydrolase [Micromonospora]MBL6274900.1 HAD-IA family hydrolase [Micromonospora fiedleri]WSK44412.1 HAD-IA family hydrolase [Micromonospora maris]